MATSGTTSTLLFGFGTFIVTRIDPNYEYLSYASGSLIAAITLSVASSFFSFWAFKTESYTRVLADNFFFLGRNIDEENIQRWEDAAPEVLQRRMIRDYIRCNRLNNECNNSK
jgi:hypothetical protein